jgi:hypothetical protein
MKRLDDRFSIRWRAPREIYSAELDERAVALLPQGACTTFTRNKRPLIGVRPCIGSKSSVGGAVIVNAFPAICYHGERAYDQDL